MGFFTKKKSMRIIEEDDESDAESDSASAIRRPMPEVLYNQIEDEDSFDDDDQVTSDSETDELDEVRNTILDTTCFKILCSRLFIFLALVLPIIICITLWPIYYFGPETFVVCGIVVVPALLFL